MSAPPDPAGRSESVAEMAPGRSITRGFLFADLRGYTEFVERRGAPRRRRAQLSASGRRPDGVFFSGFSFSGGPELRIAMVEAGHAAIPFLGWEGIYDDGTGGDEDSFLARAGAAAAGSYSTRITIVPPRSDFTDRYRTAYGAEPSSDYVAPGYACAEIIIRALRDVAATGPSADRLREAVRAHVADPSKRYDTVLGTVAFDANGDTTQQLVTIYRAEPATDTSPGGWVNQKQLNVASAP